MVIVHYVNMYIPTSQNKLVEYNRTTQVWAKFEIMHTKDPKNGEQ